MNLEPAKGIQSWGASDRGNYSVAKERRWQTNPKVTQVLMSTEGTEPVNYLKGRRGARAKAMATARKLPRKGGLELTSSTPSFDSFTHMVI